VVLLSTTHIFQSISFKLESQRVDPALVSVSSGASPLFAVDRP